MMQDELNAVDLTAEEKREIHQKILDYKDLIEHLKTCKTVRSVVEVLYVELTTHARSSHIQRIYGRYRRLVPARDIEDIYKWRHKHGKS